ncbi:MAG TPA: isoprenyl transferase [Thermodesulfobacteriota bacterium]|jgi:undecaprenyl diphosphate synthase|nr:isoprenyl transferase [Thermodesulfobacteriota bacterium]
MEKLLKDKLPKHIAIIMDGNGRWAKKRSFDRIRGHQEGIESARAVVKCCRELGIQVLTLYAFSLENWSRPAIEIKALMELLKRYLKSELSELIKNNIRLNVIGDTHILPEDVWKMVSEAVQKTAANKGMILNIALSYSGRNEIVQAVRKISRDLQDGKITSDQISEDTFEQYLFTAGLPDPDLLIRTSGEYRISNFLLWQIAYTELYVTDVLWPDFRKDNLILALLDFQKRERRFGLTHEQIKNA